MENMNEDPAQVFSDFGMDMDEVARASSVVEELHELKDSVASIEAYDATTSRAIMAAAESLMLVASIGHQRKAKPDLQSHNYTTKEADLQSIAGMAADVWRKLVEAVKSAIDWIVGFVKKIFGLNRTNAQKLDKLEEKVQKEVEEIPEKKQKAEKEAPAPKPAEKPVKEKAAPTPKAAPEPTKTEKIEKIEKYQIDALRTASIDTILNEKLTSHNADNLAYFTADMVEMKATYHAWSEGRVTNLNFFHQKLKSADLGYYHLKGAGSISCPVGGYVFIVHSDTPPPKNKIPTEFLKEMRDFIGYIKMEKFSAPKNPSVGKQMKLSLPKETVLKLIKQTKIFQERLNDFEQWMEAFIKQMKDVVRDSHRESEGGSSKEIAQMTAIRFLLNGPAVRFITDWTKVIGNTTSFLEGITK